MRKPKDTPTADVFSQALLRIVENAHPETLEEAVKLADGRRDSTEKAVIEQVLRLESEGKLLFEKPPATVPSSLTEYFFSAWSLWFWGVFGLATVASVMVFTVSEAAFPMVYARYLFGSFFVLFLPGYSLVKVLFTDRELDIVERVALSIGLSLALVPLAGLLLNYTPWGIRTTPVTLSLLGLTVVFASAAVVRDYEIQRRTIRA